MGKLNVRVCEAKGLADTHFIGQPNTYCTVTVGSETQTTRVVDGSITPRWDEVFSFEIKDEGELSTTPIIVKVWNKRTSGESLGQCTFSLSDLKRGVIADRTCNLEGGPKKKNHPEIRVRLLAVDFGQFPQHGDNISGECMSPYGGGQSNASVGPSNPNSYPAFQRPQQQQQHSNSINSDSPTTNSSIASPLQGHPPEGYPQKAPPQGWYPPPIANYYPMPPNGIPQGGPSYYSPGFQGGYSQAPPPQGWQQQPYPGYPPYCQQCPPPSGSQGEPYQYPNMYNQGALASQQSYNNSSSLQPPKTDMSEPSKQLNSEGVHEGSPQQQQQQPSPNVQEMPGPQPQAYYYGPPPSQEQQHSGSAYSSGPQGSSSSGYPLHGSGSPYQQGGYYLGGSMPFPPQGGPYPLQQGPYHQGYYGGYPPPLPQGGPEPYQPPEGGNSDAPFKLNPTRQGYGFGYGN